MSSAITEAKDFLLPLQVGCGVKCGGDAVVHEAMAFLEEHENEPAFTIASADAENAFKKPHLRLGDELIRNREET